MSEHEHPVTITDKRGQRRAGAEAEADLRADHPGHGEHPEPDDDRLRRVRQALLDGKKVSPEDGDWFAARQEDTAQADPNAPLSVRTAFLVVVNHDGSMVATPDVNISLDGEHLATHDEMYAAMSVVMRDIQAGITGRAVLAGIQQMSQDMSSAQRASQTVNGLGLDPRNLHRR